MNREAYVLPASAALLRPRRKEGWLLPYVKITLLFLFFLCIGLFLYALLLPLLHAYRCGMADHFLCLEGAVGAVGMPDLLRLVFDCTAGERFLLIIAVASAFSFLCPVFSCVFASFYGIASGVAIGYTYGMMAEMAILPKDMVCFIIFRAFCSAVILHLFSQATITARQIYDTHERAFSFACSLLLGKLWQATICYMLIYAASLCFAFIL